MKTLQHTKYALFYLSVFFLLLSCEKETPEIVEEQELITTVELQFQASGEAPQTIRWEVDQTNATTVTLKANTAYEVAITFLDESDPGDVENITEEVQEEADEHQVFYEFSGVTIDLSSGRSDTLDSDGNPVFLHTVWNATATGTGIIKAYLIHEPTSKTSTTRAGFGGETDVAIEIPLTVVE